MSVRRDVNALALRDEGDKAKPKEPPRWPMNTYTIGKEGRGKAGDSQDERKGENPDS